MPKAGTASWFGHGCVAGSWTLDHPRKQATCRWWGWENPQNRDSLEKEALFLWLARPQEPYGDTMTAFVPDSTWNKSRQLT